MNSLVRLATAIRVLCLDAGEKLCGVKYSEEELQLFWDTHPHRYFEIATSGAVAIVEKKITASVLRSIENADLELAVRRVSFGEERICLLNSWVSSVKFESWCEARSIELGEAWNDLWMEEQKIAFSASEAGEEHRRNLEGQNPKIDLDREFENAGIDQLFEEIAKLRASLKQRVPPEEIPLQRRERNTLLTIVAALCKEAKIDYTKPSKAASMIQSTAVEMGLSIGESTIEGHLKKIPDALETRMK